MTDIEQTQLSVQNALEALSGLGDVRTRQHAAICALSPLAPLLTEYTIALREVVDTLAGPSHTQAVLTLLIVLERTTNQVTRFY